MIKNNKPAFIFDLDGTLINNMSFHQLAWQQILKEYGYTATIEELKRILYGKNEDIIQRVFQSKFTLSEMHEISARKELLYRQIYKPHCKPVDGLIPFLEQAKMQNILLGIGTAADSVNTDFILTELNIHSFFDAIITNDDVEFGKPHPQTFLLAAQKLSVEPSQCIVFEDVPKGLEAATRAGMKTVIMLTTHQTSDFETNKQPILFAENYLSIDFKALLQNTK